MPTLRIGVTFWPRKTPPSCVVNHDCGTWRSWNSSMEAAAVAMASRKSAGTEATADSISSLVTRRTSTSAPSNWRV